MTAWLLASFSGLEALHLSDSVERPTPGPGETLIRIRYAALNPADRYLAENLYPARPELPHILGRDGYGIIETLGDDVLAFQTGDRVAILRGEAGVDKPGTFAEFVVVPQEVVAPVPHDWEETQVAAAPLVYVTAHQALNQWGRLEAATVLITGVSGGVGIASLELAKAYGHRVIGLTRDSSKAAKLKELGADLLLDPSDDQLKARVKDFAGKQGVNLVVDNIGGSLLNTIVDTLGYRGRISVVGMLAGPIPSFNTAKLLFRRIRLGGVSVSDYTAEESQRAWQEVVSLMNAAGIRPVVDSVFPMERLKEAFARLAEGPLGKVLLEVWPDPRQL